MRRLFALAFFLASSGCATMPPAHREWGPRIHVQGSVFKRDPKTGFAEIPFTIENRGGPVVLLARCGERLITAVDQEWLRGWIRGGTDGFCPAFLSSGPMPLAGGDARSGTRTVSDTGRFRLRIGTSGYANDADDWSITSNEFVVE